MIIMTSNIGSQEILDFQREQKADFEKLKTTVLNLLRQYFRPEFLNRIDETIVFHALGISQLHEITNLLLQRLNDRLAETALFNLTWTEEALDYLAQKGYEPSFGARPLKRLIQQEVETPLSKLLLQGKIPAQSTIQLDKENDSLTFKVSS